MDVYTEAWYEPNEMGRGGNDIWVYGRDDWFGHFVWRGWVP